MLSRLQIAVVILAVGLCGCSGRALDNAIRAANVAGAVADHAHAVLVDSTREAYSACVARETRAEALACVDVVRARHAPAWAFYRGVRLGWLQLASVIQAALAGDGTLSSGGAELLASLARSVRELEAALEHEQVSP